MVICTPVLPNSDTATSYMFSFTTSHVFFFFFFFFFFFAELLQVKPGFLACLKGFVHAVYSPFLNNVFQQPTDRKKKSTKQQLQGAIHVIYYFLMFPFLFVLLVVVCSALGSIKTFEKKKQQIKALVLLTGLIVCFVI